MIRVMTGMRHQLCSRFLPTHIARLAIDTKNDKLIGRCWIFTRLSSAVGRNCRGHKQVFSSDYGRARATARDLDFPCDILCRGPTGGRRGIVGRAICVWAAPLHPISMDGGQQQGGGENSGR